MGHKTLLTALGLAAILGLLTPHSAWAAEGHEHAEEEGGGEEGHEEEEECPEGTPELTYLDKSGAREGYNGTAGDYAHRLSLNGDFLAEEVREIQKYYDEIADYQDGLLLLGSVGFVVSLFALVNWSDKDIIRYTWITIGSTITIFIAVLYFSALNEWVKVTIVDWSVTEDLIPNGSLGTSEESGIVRALVVGAFHMLGWFLMLQVVSFYLRGALLHDSHWLRDHRFHDYNKVVEQKSDKHQRRLNRIPPQLLDHAYSWACKKKVEDGIAQEELSTVDKDEKVKAVVDQLEKMIEEDHKEKKLAEYREYNTKCFGEILAHMTAFACIHFFGELQGFLCPAEHKSMMKAGAILPLSIGVLFVIFKLMKWLRSWRIATAAKAGSENASKEIEEQVHEAAEEGENDVMGLVVSFLSVQFVRFVGTGFLPDAEGNMCSEEALEDCSRRGHLCSAHHKGKVTSDYAFAELMALLLFNVISLAGLSVIVSTMFKKEREKKAKERENKAKEEKEGEKPKEEEEEEEERIFFGQIPVERSLDILRNYFGFCAAWSKLFIWTVVLPTYVGVNPTGHLFLVVRALVVSAVGFAIVLVLDKIADSKDTGDKVDECIKKVILAQGTLIGLGWEGAFDKAVEAVSEGAPVFGEEEEHHVVGENLGRGPAKFKAMVLVALLCLFLAMAYRLYILPTICRLEEEAEEDEEKEAEKEKKEKKKLAPYTRSSGSQARESGTLVQPLLQ